MFDWLRSFWKTNLPPMKPSVSFDQELVTFRRANGAIEEVSWDELAAVEILTTDDGPFVCDVFFVLRGDNGGCVVPQEADGCEQLLERLQRLPGFNNQSVIEAMCCTSNARFSAWQKEGKPPSSNGM